MNEVATNRADARRRRRSVRSAAAERLPSADQNPLPPLTDRVSFVVHRVNARIGQVCTPMFAALDVDLYSSRILALLHERSEMTVGELVDVMVLPQSTISHQLQRLDRRRLIHRRRSAADNRSVTVSLTADGKRLAKQCYELGAAVHLSIASRFSAQEMQLLGELLHRMFDSLDHIVEVDI